MPFNIRPPALADAVQVCVWNNRNVVFGIPGTHVGHVAAQLYRSRRRCGLISWWPEEGANKLDGPVRGRAESQLSWDAHGQLSDETRTWLRINVYRPRPGQVESRRRGSFDFDWIQLPDDTIPIPGMSSNGPLWGLNIGKIAEWWKGWTPDQTYRMMSTTNNCSGAVWQALVAGGARHFVNPAHHAVFVTPLNVRAWSSSVADRLNSLNARTVFTNDAVKEFMGTFGALNAYKYEGEVMSVDKWKRMSALNWTQPRSAMVRNIDSSLSAYHNARSDNMNKYFALANVMDAICQFRESKPDSKRMAAVLVLARDVIKKAREISSACAASKSLTAAS